jgi:hypothetical protein
MSTTEAERPVLIYHDFETWEPTLDSMLRRAVGCKDLTELGELVKAEDDWTTTLGRAAEVFRGERVDVVGVVADSVRTNYRALRAFHCTRTENVGSFHRHGILKRSAEELERLALSVFSSERFPGITEDAVRNALERPGVNAGHRAQTVNFFLSPNGVRSRNNNFLTYGNEFLHSVAVELNVVDRYVELYVTPAVGTVFVCDVPLSYIPKKHFDGHVCDAICSVIAAALGLAARNDLPYGVRDALVIGRTLPPECLLDHCKLTDGDLID